MKYELTIYELGQLLNKITTSYTSNVLAKIKLNAGWFTITGAVEVDYVPTEQVLLKGNNIISLKIINTPEGGATVKITGEKDKKFIVDLSAAKYKKVNLSGLNIDKIETNNDECKLRIGDDIIFTINTSSDDVSKLLPQ